nr:lipase 3-like [Nerophis lumbriciformis]
MKKALLILVALFLVACSAYFFTPPQQVYRTALAVEQRLAGLVTKSVDVDGLNWQYLEGGRGKPLVLLHGFAADKGNWIRLARHLSKDARIIAPDLIGFGDSASPADAAYDIAAQASRVLAFADAIGLHEFDVGGSSMGGYIAGEMFRQQPDRLRSMLLLAPGGVISAANSEMFELILQQGRNPLIIHDRADVEKTWEFVFNNPPFFPLRARHGFADLQLGRAEAYEKIFTTMTADALPVEDALRGADVPTLIVWGQKDRVLHPQGGQKLVEIMHQATLVMLPEVGHLPMVEVPEVTAATYLDWRQKRGL